MVLASGAVAAGASPSARSIVFKPRVEGGYIPLPVVPDATMPHGYAADGQAAADAIAQHSQYSVSNFEAMKRDMAAVRAELATVKKENVGLKKGQATLSKQVTDAKSAVPAMRGRGGNGSGYNSGTNNNNGNSGGNSYRGRGGARGSRGGDQAASRGEEADFPPVQ